MQLSGKVKIRLANANINPEDPPRSYVRDFDGRSFAPLVESIKKNYGSSLLHVE